MSSEPRNPDRGVDYSARVDQVGRRAQLFHSLRVTAVIIFTIIGLIPVYWMGATAFKSRSAVVSIPPKATFSPTLEGFVNLMTERSILPQSKLEEFQQRDDLPWYQEIAANQGQEVTGLSDFPNRLKNSLIIAGGSTIAAVFLGLLAAYAFSRFAVPGKEDWLFFILSTRMLPPMVVVIPIFLMYRSLGLHDSYTGMIILYTAFNLSLSVWLLKGFIDEIPLEYEEAALVDGYSRLQAFIKIVVPQALTGIAATTVFSFIFAWNEYAFALMLTSQEARTAPVSLPSMLGRGGIEWSAIAAGTLVFLLPVVILTFFLRQHLLRGVTFGAIRQ